MDDNDLIVKVDILDLIISVLRDHEKALDESARRLEAVVKKLNAERRKKL